MRLLEGTFDLDDPATATRLRRVAEVLEASSRNTIASRAHAIEQVGLAALANGQLDVAQTQLAAALDRFREAGQMFCAIHCCEAVAWLCAARNDIDAAGRLTSAAEGLRQQTSRTRAAFEEPAIRGVRSALGTLPPPDLDADLDSTIELALELLHMPPR